MRYEIQNYIIAQPSSETLVGHDNLAMTIWQETFMDECECLQSVCFMSP